jgi:hypothetical protein
VRWGVECERDVVGSGGVARWGAARAALWGVECGRERRHGTVESGDGGATARRVGVECERDAVGSDRATRWGVETVEQRCGTVGSRVPTRCGGERRCDAVGSGDGGVRRESMGIGERSAVRVLAR